MNPFATVLFSVCSAVTIECCVLYPCCMGVFGMFAPTPLFLSLSLYTWEYPVKLCKDILYSVSLISVNDNTVKFIFIPSKKCCRLTTFLGRLRMLRLNNEKLSGVVK